MGMIKAPAAQIEALQVRCCPVKPHLTLLCMVVVLCPAFENQAIASCHRMLPSSNLKSTYRLSLQGIMQFSIIYSSQYDSSCFVLNSVSTHHSTDSNAFKTEPVCFCEANGMCYQVINSRTCEQLP